MTDIIDFITSRYKIVLASSSPRRYEIMHDTMGFSKVELMTPQFEENLDKGTYADKPEQYAVATSLHKAHDIVAQLQHENQKSTEPRIVVCADTIVIGPNNTIYEKPGTPEKQLKDLVYFCFGTDEPVRVVTAVTLVKWKGKHEGYSLHQFHETSKVHFDREIPEAVVEAYVESKDGLQVAGGFKVQGASGVLISSIEGDFFNIVGLPLNKTFKAILEQAS